MTRYKGRQNAKAVEQDFPHFIDAVLADAFASEFCAPPNWPEEGVQNETAT